MEFKKLRLGSHRLRLIGPRPLVYMSHHPDGMKCRTPFRCPLCDAGVSLKKLVTWPDGTQDLLDSLTGLSPRLRKCLAKLSEHKKDN